MAVPLQSQAVQKCCSGSCLRSYSSCFSAHTLVRSNDSGRTMEHIVFFSYSSQTRFHFGFPSPRCFSHWTIFYPLGCCEVTSVVSSLFQNQPPASAIASVLVSPLVPQILGIRVLEAPHLVRTRWHCLRRL